MKRLIEKIVYLFKVSSGCRKSYKRAHFLLKDIKATDPLMRKTLKKVFLYSLFIPPLAFEYATLTGHKPTKDEIDLLLNLSAFSILHDTLLDETNDGEKWLSSLLYTEVKTVKDSSELQAVTRQVYEKIKLTKKAFLLEYLRRVHEAQLFSADLRNRFDLTSDDVRQSLVYKGIVYPIYISAFTDELTSLEFQSYCFLGGWLQAADDLSDKKQDQHEGIVTLATFAHGKYANEIEQYLWQSFADSFKQLPCDEPQKTNFILHMRMLGKIYRRYTFYENTVPYLKKLILDMPLIFTRLPIWIASLASLVSN